MVKDTVFVAYATFTALGSFVLYLSYVVTKSEKVGKLASLVNIITALLLTVSMVVRTYITVQKGWGHAPFTNLYESMVFFAWAIAVLLFIFELKYKNRSLGAFVTPFAFIILAYTSLGGPGIRTEVEPLIPALQSNWLIAHVITAFLSYAAFAVSCGASIMYLLRVNKSGGFWNRLPSAEVLDEISYKAVLIGFPLLTLGIVTGAAWAHYAWGSYWSWDPKETWSLITWFIYAAYLHARYMRGWRGKKAAFLSIIGFAAVIFTYLGVNLIISGLHSYA
ncbi:cytochrome c biogenesis protein [Thermosulfidibacter takaii ABI70S6]|uniref:Cytochrome c biogenesis protein n=1 Tax=Thermosulfidibacter takaii (strain DSM 17441 / JCM 13301 / NBRC 103674 / ABI70S6) TaxID=1298851 RepID=A0A0S3QRN9_THET7|nr:c-type cytochrome biogenesis protein CcsB [Thermosulfidibacter takaii]BAT70999.1 cytochrome c biogenesis protein [Thermosulfidibacter takaii ABI70S6]